MNHYVSFFLVFFMIWSLSVSHNLFHATGLFPYFLETSENLMSSGGKEDQQYKMS